METYDNFLDVVKERGMKVTKESRFQSYIEVEDRFHITFRSLNSPSSYKGLSAEIVICDDEEIRMSRLLGREYDRDMWKINSLYGDNGLLDFVNKSINILNSKEE